MTISDDLRNLIPAVYRQRDAEPQQGGVLDALLGVLGGQGDLVAEALAQLYDDWFIETCQPWVVPYIGDLLGVRPINPVSGGRALPRAYVANTLGYRRRKGTPAALEELARDVTGWPAKVVELFSALSTTQHVNHRRPGNLQAPTLRNATALAAVDGPFDRATRTIEARSLTAGRYNIGNVALHVWRSPTFRVARVTARPVTSPPDGRYNLDPTGLDIALHNPPLPEDSITSLATVRHLPGPLARRALYDELEAGRTGGDIGALRYFGIDPVVEIFADTGAGLAPVPPEELIAADLSDPPPNVTTGWRRPGPGLTAAIDPVLGRLAFRQGLLPDAVEVSYVYAAADALGAGPYNRHTKRSDDIIKAATFVRAVGAELPVMPDLTATNLAQAAVAWNAQAPGTVGVLAILDNATYEGDVTVVVPVGSTLLVTAATWPNIEQEDPTEPKITRLQLDDRRPHVLGSLVITGGADTTPGKPRGEIVIDGLLVEGDVTVAAGDLGRLDLFHVTVVPGRGRVAVTATNRDLSLHIDSSVLGPIHIADEGPLVSVTRSVVDGTGAAAIDTAECAITLSEVTTLGSVTCRTLHASDCLLRDIVTVGRVQDGCVRFSSVDDGSRTPLRHQCQPDLALRRTGADPVAIRALLTPQLTSTRFGDAGYAVLDDRSAIELRTGSSQRSDMGAYCSLLRPDREANLRITLEEYLRVGLNAGVFHES